LDRVRCPGGYYEKSFGRRVEERRLVDKLAPWALFLSERLVKFWEKLKGLFILFREYLTGYYQDRSVCTKQIRGKSYARLTMLCRRKGRALEISFVGSVFVYKEILIKMEPEETVVAVVEDQQLVEIYLERCGSQRIAGNIYEGIVENVLPGMQAAFVDIGLEKNSFLYVEEAVPYRVGEEDDEGNKSGRI
jgi:hypothetical protein